MLFPTGMFVIFFLVVFAVGWALWRRPSAWKCFMVAASFFFYAFWGWRFTLLLAGYTLVTYVLGRSVNSARRHRKALLAFTVVVQLLPLAFYKYFGFFTFNLSQISDWFTFASAPSLAQLVVPVGISFTTFRGISYVVDIYRGRAEKASVLDFALFMSFFPYLAAGPITRTRELLPQLKTRPAARHVDVTRGLYLITLGLAKKVVIGDFLARSLVGGVFGAPGQYSSLDVVLGIHAYAVQIYCDFSGYSDMAIGIALLLGVVLPENFDRPYTASSLRDFWRRWHITLSRWLRDYLYIPLGGSHGSRWATYRNVVITMLLAGLWHGAGWTFLVWGLLHGTGMAVEHGFAARRKRRGLATPSASGLRLAMQRVATLEFVCLAWIFFRADSLGSAVSIVARTFTAWNVGLSVSWLVIAAIAAGIGLQYLPRGISERWEGVLSRRQPLVQGLVFGLLLFMIAGVLGADGISNFIYVGF